MPFNPINTQEEFDQAIQDRLAREQKKYEGFMSPEDVAKLKADYEDKLKKQPDYTGYTSPADLKTLKDNYESQITTLTNERNALQLGNTRREIAGKYGIPESFASRLKGTTKEDIENDAKSLAEVFKKQNTTVLPLSGQDTSTGEKDKTREYLRSIAQKYE